MASSWADREDLEIRYSGEEVIKAATRSFWDESLGAFIVDRSAEKINLIIQTALDDAKALILECLNNSYSGTSLLDEHLFQAVKYNHAHLSYLILKEGSGCKECDECLKKFKEDICSKSLCTNDLKFCLKRVQSILVSPKKKSKCNPSCCDGCKHG